jgi:YfiR/HmsC-like
LKRQIGILSWIRSRFPWRRRSVRIPCALLIAGFLVLAFMPGVLRARTKPTEYEVKAVYLYNFGKFVQWPSSAPPDDAFTICVLGDDPFGGTLDSAVSGEKINGVQVQVRRIASVDNAGSCRMMFISSSETDRVRVILAAVQRAPILTVSDIPKFAQRGGMIGFVNEGDRVRFNVNLASAQRANLQLSSDLLKVAVSVIGKPGAGD